MKSRDFCYWLQGYFEISDSKALNPAQVEVMRNHLAMVFIHEIDPSFPAEQQEALRAAHEGKVPKVNVGTLVKGVDWGHISAPAGSLGIPFNC